MKGYVRDAEVKYVPESFTPTAITYESNQVKKTGC